MGNVSSTNHEIRSYNCRQLAITRNRNSHHEIATTSGQCLEVIYLLTFALRDYISEEVQKRFGNENFQEKIAEALPTERKWKPSSITLTELDFSDLLRILLYYWKIYLSNVEKRLIRRCILGRNGLSHQQMNNFEECKRLLQNLLNFDAALFKCMERSKYLYHFQSADDNMSMISHAYHKVIQRQEQSLSMATVCDNTQNQGQTSLDREEDYPKRLASSMLKKEGDKLFSTGLFLEAIEQFTYAITNDPSDADLYESRSIACFRLGDEEPRYYEYARQDAEDAIAKNPKKPKLYHLLGQTLEKLELFYEALSAYKEGLQVDPGNNELHIALEQCKVRIAEVELTLNSLADRNPGDEPDNARRVQADDSIEMVLPSIGGRRLKMPPLQNMASYDGCPGRMAMGYPGRLISTGANEPVARSPMQPSMKTIVNLMEQANKMMEEGSNLQKAKKLYEIATKVGNAEATFKLGLCYLRGTGVAADSHKALQWLKKAAAMKPWPAESGDWSAPNKEVVEAQNMLGVIYRDGLGISADQREAVAWFKKAAASGHTFAQYSLGCCYLQGDGVAVNYKKANKWFTKAANLGLTMAMYKLGKMYEKGLEVPVSHKFAREWYGKAADQGLDCAVSALARLDRFLALQEEAENGDSNFLYSLALIYMEDADGFPSDREKAEGLFKSAAEQDHLEAQHDLASLYAEKIHDQKAAFRWMLRAALNGHAEAQIKLARLYIQGRGTQRDYDKALRWALEAKTKAVHAEDAEVLLSFIQVESDSSYNTTTFVYPEERVIETFERDNGILAKGKSWRERQRRFFEGIVPSQFSNMIQYLESKHMIRMPIPNEIPVGGVLGTLCRSKQSKTAMRFAESVHYTFMASEHAIQGNYEMVVKNLYQSLLLWSPYSSVRNTRCMPLINAISTVLNKNSKSPDVLLCYISMIYDQQRDITALFSLSDYCLPKYYETAKVQEFIGHIMLAEEDYDAAKSAFTRALEKDHAQIELHYFRALTAARSKHARFQLQPSLASTAICDFQQYLAKAEPDAEFVPDAYYHVGKVFLYLGDMNRAMHCYELGLAAENPTLRLPIFSRVDVHHKAPLEAFHRSPARKQQKAMANSLKDLSKYPTATLLELICFQCMTEYIGMRRCAECKIAFYCSRKCQLANWQQHKIICKYVLNN